MVRHSRMSIRARRRFAACMHRCALTPPGATAHLPDLHLRQVGEHAPSRASHLAAPGAPGSRRSTPWPAPGGPARRAPAVTTIAWPSCSGQAVGVTYVSRLFHLLPGIDCSKGQDETFVQLEQVPTLARKDVGQK